jgi:hypothetical protein
MDSSHRYSGPDSLTPDYVAGRIAAAGWLTRRPERRLALRSVGPSVEVCGYGALPISGIGQRFVASFREYPCDLDVSVEAFAHDHDLVAIVTAAREIQFARSLARMTVSVPSAVRDIASVALRDGWSAVAVPNAEGTRWSFGPAYGLRDGDA